MKPISGNTQGLKPSQRKQLERLFRRRTDPMEVVSRELAHGMCQCASEFGRQIGVLIDRSGAITDVIVGSAHQLLLPELGRERIGAARLRGVRLVHTHLRSEPLTRDDLTDLARLRLDLVSAIGMRPNGEPSTLSSAHLVPENPTGALWRELPPEPIAAAKLDFLELIQSLEEEFARTRSVQRTDLRRDRAVLVHVALGRDGHPEARVQELRELARTAGLQVVDAVVQHRSQGPDPRFLVGRGKLDEIVLRAMQRDATVLVFDPELTPTQARSVSDATELKVIDRTMLILDIFAQHARSRDGKLQTELAQLKYTLPRLVEKNTMMSRLTGGIGGRGPGETKLEINRRRARERIHQLEQEIQTLGHRRAERRSLRTSRDVPVAAIVGYTNAGKSTLWNVLTGGETLVENKLFATLDPTSRRLYLGSSEGEGRGPQEVVLIDTVGFIRDLPKDLISAFRATLEELDEASVLIHVVDGSDPEHDAQIAAVDRILSDLGLDQKPRLLVFNKADRLSPEEVESLARTHQAQVLSAQDRNTLRPLVRALAATFAKLS